MTEYTYPGSVSRSAKEEPAGVPAAYGPQGPTMRQVVADGLGAEFHQQGPAYRPVPTDPVAEMEFLSEVLGRTVPPTASQRQGEAKFYIKQGWILFHSAILDAQIVLADSRREFLPMDIPRMLDDRPVWWTKELRSLYEVACKDSAVGHDMLQAAHRVKSLLGGEVL